MIIATPADDHLCVAPELAILTVLELTLATAAQVLNIAHTEIIAPGAAHLDVSADAAVAAEIIVQATHLIAAINRYRLVLLDPACLP